jgi:hypothetical protein
MIIKEYNKTALQNSGLLTQSVNTSNYYAFKMQILKRKKGWSKEILIN